MYPISEIAKPYIETSKPGDVLRVGSCDNPFGWRTVFRNDKPIHHFRNNADAEALCYAIANGEPTKPISEQLEQRYPWGYHSEDKEP